MLPGIGAWVLVAAACGVAQPLGDGTLSGRIPGGWHEVERDDPEIVVMLHDDSVPLPREIVVRRLPESSEAPTEGWSMTGEFTVPAPDTRVGDRWRPNTRRVRRYRRAFSADAVFEADVDTGLDRRSGERFLRSLRPTSG